MAVTGFYPRLGITPCVSAGRLQIGQEVSMFLTLCEPVLGALLRAKEAPAKDLSRETSESRGFQRRRAKGEDTSSKQVWNGVSEESGKVCL